MVVGGALVLVGATVKSEFQKFGDGYRLTTKNVLDVGFGTSALKPEDCRTDGAQEPTILDLVAICTEHSLTDKKMAPLRKSDVQCAVVSISSVRQMKSPTSAEEPGRKAFMIMDASFLG